MNMTGHTVIRACVLTLMIVTFICTGVRAEITEQDFTSIRNLIDKYEAAYSQKDIKGMVDCCDKDSQWFNGLEENMKKEFDRYQYIRLNSKEKRLVRDPIGNREDDLVCIRRAFYIAFIDSEAPRVGNSQNTSASLNEYDAVYYLTRMPVSGDWKIKMFGQMANEDQIAYFMGKNAVLHGKIQDAFAEFKKSISKNSEYSPAYSGLSDLSFAVSNLSDSIKYAEKAAELQPNVAYYHYSLGMVYLYAKNKEKALKEFEKAKMLDKDFPGIDYFITNVDKVMTALDSRMKAETINESIAKVLAIKIEGNEDNAIIPDLNLIVNKPKNWKFIPRSDWHTFVAMSTVDRPLLTDPMVNINVRPIIDKETAEVINFSLAGKLAIFFGNKAIVRLGKSEKVNIAGIQAYEDYFAYTVNEMPVIAIVTTFEKGKMTYTLVYTDKAKDMKIDTRPYKELIAGIKFIDPNKDISTEIVDTFIAAERSK